MGKSIHPMCAEKPGAVLVLHSRRSSVRMSLQPAIPWRVALQQSPTPLHRLSIILKEKQSLEKTITLNGNCVFGKLSHSKGSPQYHPGLKSETWGTPHSGHGKVDSLKTCPEASFRRYLGVVSCAAG